MTSMSVDHRRLSFDCNAAGDQIKVSEPTGTKDLVVVRLLIFESTEDFECIEDCVEDVLDSITVPDLVAKINASSPVTHQLLTEGTCGALSYAIKESEQYDWIQIEPSTSEIIVAPGSDALPGVYPLTLQVGDREIPFQVTIEPDEEIQDFHLIFKTAEEEGWQFDIPEEIQANYSLAIAPYGNPLEGILELTQTELVIRDLSNPELKTGKYYVDLIFTAVSGEQMTQKITLSILEPFIQPAEIDAAENEAQPTEYGTETTTDQQNGEEATESKVSEHASGSVSGNRHIDWIHDFANFERLKKAQAAEQGEVYVPPDPP